MVQARLRNDVIERRHGAGLRIERAEYQTADARVDDGAGAHHAGFERHVQRRISEPVIAKGLRRRAHRQHFSVRTRITHADRLVPAFADDAIAANDERSEEHTSELQSLMRISYAVFCLKKKKIKKKHK